MPPLYGQRPCSTSLVNIIRVTEFFRATNNINNRVFQFDAIYGFVAVVYVICCLGLSPIGQRLLERLDPAAGVD